MRFYNSDGTTLLETTYAQYSVVPGIPEPKIVPSKIAANLDMYEVYTWRGWARKLDPTTIVDLSKLTPTADIDFIAVYDNKPSGVYDE